MKYVALLAAALALGACNVNVSSIVPVTSAICTEAGQLQAGGLALTLDEQFALISISTACAATSGGTVFTSAALQQYEQEILNNAKSLQQSGLFSDLHITALAADHPDQARMLKKIKAHWGFH